MSSFSSTGIDLTTERLVLRPWSTDELAAVLRYSRLKHWAEDFPSEGDRVIAGILPEHPDALSGSGHSQIIERAGGLVVGSIGLFWPPSNGSVEVGYGIVASRRGRGYAPEATRAVVEFALTEPAVHTVHAEAELSNPASVRVLEKAGLHRWSEDTTTARFRITKPDTSQR